MTKIFWGVAFGMGLLGFILSSKATADTTEPATPPSGDESDPNFVGPRNFVGPPAPAPAADAIPSPGTLVYTVARGDSLSSIAAKLYGDVRWWPMIYDLNSGAIGANPDVIGVGQIFQLLASAPATCKAAYFARAAAAKKLFHNAGAVWDSTAGQQLLIPTACAV